MRFFLIKLLLLPSFLAFKNVKKNYNFFFGGGGRGGRAGRGGKMLPFLEIGFS